MEKAKTGLGIATAEQTKYYEDNMFNNSLWDRLPHTLAGRDTYLLLRTTTGHFTTIKCEDSSRFINPEGEWVHLVDNNGQLM